MRCPSCGEELILNNLCKNPKCPYFGMEVTDFSQSENKSHIHIMTNSFKYNSDFFTFIGNNSSYYLKYASKFENDKGFISWNWPCFFLSWYWLLYRKLYIPAIILIGINIASFKLFERTTYLVVILIIRTILAMFANNIYLNTCKQKINVLKGTIANLNASEYTKKLRKKGGVTLVAPVILLILSILATMIYIIILFSNMSNAPSYSGSYYL